MLGNSPEDKFEISVAPTRSLRTKNAFDHIGDSGLDMSQNGTQIAVFVDIIPLENSQKATQRERFPLSVSVLMAKVRELTS